MSDRVQGFNARDCGDWSRNPSRRPVVWATPSPVDDAVDITIMMTTTTMTVYLSREDARALASYILALTD